MHRGYQAHYQYGIDITKIWFEAMTKIKDLSAAFALFEESASKHAEATEQGNYRVGNKCYASIVKAIAFIKEQGEIKALLNFLTHPSVGVRIWAATYILPVQEKEGVRVLEQIMKEEGIHSLDAKTTLSEWRKGNLKL